MSGGTVAVQRRVLLVDDDPLLLDVLATVLDLQEFDVVTATGGDEALAIVARDHIDILVCDVRMPGTDGLEVCRQLKRDPATADLPVILLTARDSAAGRADGQQVGCDAYITKPFSPLELLDVLRSYAPRRPTEGA